MPSLLTYYTPSFLKAFRFLLVTLLLVVFGEVLLEFAAGRGFFVFTTTPPHSVSPFAAVSAARPIVVFFFVVLFIAVLTQFLVEIDVASLSELSDFYVE